MDDLPDYKPVGVKEVKAPFWWRQQEIPLGVVFPKIKKYKEYLVINEYGMRPLFEYKKDEGWFKFWVCIERGFTLKIWKKEDHPNIKLLPLGVPRVVKKLYLAEYQLAYLRMTDCSSYMRDDSTARAAWETFNRNNTKGKLIKIWPKNETPD